MFKDRRRVALSKKDSYVCQTPHFGPEQELGDHRILVETFVAHQEMTPNTLVSSLIFDIVSRSCQNLLLTNAECLQN